jgi:hypothetical protein
METPSPEIGILDVDKHSVVGRDDVLSLIIKGHGVQQKRYCVALLLSGVQSIRYLFLSGREELPGAVETLGLYSEDFDSLYFYELGEETDQCDGQTLEGKQCTKMGKISVRNGEHLLCWSHWTKWYKETHGCTVVPEPWQLLGFKQGPGSNAPLGDLRSALRNDFPVKPQEGHVYVYRMDSDGEDEPMFKIGYTTQGVHQRLDQWPGSVLVNSWRTSRAHYAETLIHLYLNHWRVYRFVMYASKAKPGQHKRFVSTWYASPSKPVHDAVWASKTCPEWLPMEIYEAIQKDTLTPEINITAKSKKTRYAVEREWFYCEYEYVERIIGTVVDGISKNEKNWHRKFQ